MSVARCICAVRGLCDEEPVLRTGHAYQSRPMGDQFETAC